jgi:hypothetical protein
MALAPGSSGFPGEIQKPNKKALSRSQGLKAWLKRWSVRLRKYLQPWLSPGKGKVKRVIQTAQPFHVLSP